MKVIKMETQVRTPQMVFMQAQRLVVPLFQRPYVWNELNQWEPLWNDLARVAQRVLQEPHGRHHPHFLGAVVVQQLQNPLGTMQERTIIDGQQRLTTLQLLLDALHAELLLAGAEQPAMRIETLVKNAEAFWERPEDRFKVWPTNRDRAAFNAAMAAEPPMDYAAVGHAGSRLVQAHAFFAARAREWLAAVPDQVSARAGALERAVRELMQMVVIDLSADENAQEIFETLNARGAQLTAADLIKNFVFQRLTESGVDVEAAYEQHWKEFETGFWEREISAGRVRHQRSSMFLNQWLIAKTGDEILAREVFYRFKNYADFDAGLSMVDLLGQIHRAGAVYAKFVKAAAQLTGPIDRLGVFAYRTGVLESEVVKPLMIFLLDPDEPPVPQQQLTKALEVIESWLVRRMLVRATSKSYTQVIAELISQIRKHGRDSAGEVLEQFLQQQSAANWYWPDDDEVRAELRDLAAYRRLSRGRLRMVLEAVEDDLRGWRGDTSGLGGERVARGKLQIEHVMPRKWQTHWPLPSGTAAVDRDVLVDNVGNLTLLTGRLNSKISNGPWLGEDGKKTALKGHDVLMLNRRLLEAADHGWDEALIRDRADRLIESILRVWPVPAGHRSAVSRARPQVKRGVEVSDLIGAGLLEEGMTLHARRQRVAGRTATVLPDGGIDVDGVRHSTPSGAARAVAGNSQNGWHFWLVDPKSRRSLRDVLREYVEQADVDVEDDLAEDDDDFDDDR
jgi:hypothetical protein